MAVDNGIMEELNGEEDPCEQCGLCCRIFGPDISPTASNVYIWMEQGRTDILSWFVAFMDDREPVICSGLRAEDLGHIVSCEFRNPDTGERVPVCPFLRRVAKKRYLCGIHSVKPEMCCNYQPWIWGETCFNRCPALGKTEGNPKWPL